jgi:hypothetical protein
MVKTVNTVKTVDTVNMVNTVDTVVMANILTARTANRQRDISDRVPSAWA